MHVVLSPHFDDAVYSLGGAIHTWTRAGQPVFVLNVMGAQPQHLPNTPIVRELHARWALGESPVKIRQLEDAQALTKLGAHYRNLPFLDCVYRTDTNRQALYPSEASIFGAIHPRDALTHQLIDYDPSTIIGSSWHNCHLYAPLAVGNHVDHRIVRDWALTLPVQSLHLYADYPYTRDAHAITEAHQQLHDVSLVSSPITLTTPALQAKIQSATCYRSQISTFWRDDDALRAEMIRAFTTVDGRYQEPLWRVNR